MNAVFRHEVSSHFTNLTAYVFGAFLLLFAGIYTMVLNLSNLVTNFEYVLGNMSFVFLVIVPILTMRVLAEERRQKTDQLLYSLPISMTEVVLGKYFALLVMLLIPLGIISLYPIVLSAFGSIYFPASYGSIVGFFLLGAALIAIGLFISSISESQAVAAGLCFVVMLLNYYI
ncbi:MAG: ABC transporter permease subunit, partial [Oscillospiraceae bacterium]|nr:ABC transporter permease subunit [Oscillospiraceae bacterium]